MPVTHKKHHKQEKKTPNVVSDCSGAEINAGAPVIQSSSCCSTAAPVTDLSGSTAPDLSGSIVDTPTADLSGSVVNAPAEDLSGSVVDTPVADLSGSVVPVVTSAGCCAASTPDTTPSVDLSGAPADLSGVSVPVEQSQTPVIISSGCCSATGTTPASVEASSAVPTDLSGAPSADLSGSIVRSSDLSGSVVASPDLSGSAIVVTSDLSGSAVVATTNLSGSVISATSPVEVLPSSPQKSKSSGCAIM
jgi:hypothetical protein